MIDTVNVVTTLPLPP